MKNAWVDHTELHGPLLGFARPPNPDLGSGMNYHKKSLKLLLDNILAGKLTVFSARLYGSRSRKIKSS